MVSQPLVVHGRTGRRLNSHMRCAVRLLCHSEVCKISVRSAQKLLDHVNFSPLHKAALEGGGAKLSIGGGGSGSSLNRGQRRVLYDGSKLFWRVNETLELCVYEDTGANSVTVAAFQQQPQQQQQQQLVAVSPVVLDAQRLRKALGIPSTGSGAAVDLMGRPAVSEGMTPSASDLVIKLLLARLQARKDAHGSTSLFLQRLHNGEADPSQLLLVQHQPHVLLGLPSDLNVRRRHTIDDVKKAEKEVKVAAAELRQAQQQAESFSQLARISLEAFSRRNVASDALTDPKRRASDWARVYDRVALQNAVERSKEAIATLDQPRSHLQADQPQQ